MKPDALALTFHGVRGSMPTSSPETQRYGGHTTCVEVALSPKHRLLLDCGTGLTSLQESLPADRSGLQFDVLLSHYHSDHVMGLPFFRPLYDASCSFTFHGYPWQGRGVQAVLEDTFAPPHFPISLRDTGSKHRFVDLNADGFDLGPLRIRHTRLRHPQGVTAFRLEQGSRSVVFATDYERGDRKSDDRFDALCKGADVLIHDAQYTPEEYRDRKQGWGHSTWAQAAEAAGRAGVSRLVLFHHDPRRTDAQVDALVEQTRREFPEVEAAHEGLVIEI